MEFFDAPPPHLPEPPPRPPHQEWMGPPPGWLGGFVPVRLELARTAEAVLLLGPMEAFPSGVLFDLSVTSRTPSDGMGPMGPMGEGFRFGVAFADGNKWQGMEQGPNPWGPPPPAPFVWFHGGSGGGGRFVQRLWLWPLPPPGAVTFAVSAPAFGIEERTVAVDGEAFRRAATDASKLWEPLSPEEEADVHRQRMARIQAMRPGAASTMHLQASRPDPPDPPA